MTGSFRLSASVLALALLTGCTFSRSVVNGHVRRLDTSWIEPGKTTRADIIARLGRPPAMIGSKGVRPGTATAMSMVVGLSGRGGGMAAVGMNAEGEAEGQPSNAFRWSASDSYMKMFEGGYIFYPTLSATRHSRGHDIFILFDDRDVVRLVSRTETTDGEVALLEWREASR